jgi:hypothetical protein
MCKKVNNQYLEHQLIDLINRTQEMPNLQCKLLTNLTSLICRFFYRSISFIPDFITQREGSFSKCMENE